MYVGPANEGRDLFKATIRYEGYANPPQPSRDLEFVVKYTVNGQTYWDNNQGRNYFVAADQGPLLNGTNVLVDSARLRSYDNTLEVNIDVQNLAYEKEVKVVYTTDHWATWHEASATFSSGYYYGYAWVESPNVAGVERWNLYLPGITADRVEFAVAYTVAGQTYWDNNFGANSVVQR